MEKEGYSGLSEKEVRERISKGLVNETNTSVSKTTGQIIRTHSLTYFNFLNIFLGALVVVSGQIKNLTFMAIIIINTIIGIFQELKVKKLVDGLSVITATKATVLRDGKRKEIPIDQIVMDDVIAVESGNQISADSIVLESTGIEVNESMITGESRPVKKKQGDTLFSGSYLVAGSGLARVEHVGKDNYATVLANQAKDKKRATSEMQDSIKRIIKTVGFIIIPVGILLFISQLNVAGMTLSDALVNTVAGVIGMIPEGLVLLTSISFILGVGRLAGKRALVQEMEAIEALARVNVLCTDKTGTITTGDLQVTDLIPLSELSVEEIRTIMNEIAFAFDDVNNTQTALMNYFTDTKEWEITDAIPFSSARKFRAISFKDHGAYVLGAPEFIMKGNESLAQQVEVYSEKGLRVLLLASARYISSEEEQVEGVSPLALILISDCIRTEARATFEYFASQNVAVKVISGDNPATVSHIAVEAGLADGEKYVDATQLPQDDERLRQMVDDITVYGRVTPEQKQRIIKAYQANGKVVGMVGDGVNDVLALKDADCGIAMAAGSDAAKQVAHIVLLDSDFACMQDIVREGRMIISNIERVSALYLTKTIYSVLLNVIFIIIGRAYPFVPIHLSLISAAAIGLPSFFLALEQTETVTQDGFLKNVLQVALPGALVMVISMLINQVLGTFFALSSDVLSAYNLLVASSISMIILIKVSSPLNMKRKILCIVCGVVLVGGVLFFGDFFSVTTIFQWRMIFVIPVVAITYPMMNGFMTMMRRLTSIRHKKKKTVMEEG
ncbi:cation-transporting ATPase E [Catenibacillus scindens]|uniref:Cation-transporting ATPase E n=1 Tax=Catenibacillus scindens TaxID=673271 RepID=A0A7W8H7G1_9FIRM|nr:HAD-IC family P-type ATPase [Catenibacillus scindens]MBB5263209.1 cation-transporting ATPase E [Catenibacillus scindens]